MRVIERKGAFFVEVPTTTVSTSVELSREEVREAFALLCEAECRKKVEYEDGERPSHRRIVNWARDAADDAVEEYVAP